MIVKKCKHKFAGFCSLEHPKSITIKTYRLCGGLKINDLVRCHPLSPCYCNASFIYHQKCLRALEKLFRFTLRAGFWCTAVTGKPGLTKNNNKNLVTLERFSFFFCANTQYRHSRHNWYSQLPISCGLARKSFLIFNDTKTFLLFAIFYVLSKQRQFSAFRHRWTTAIVPAAALGLVELAIHAATVLRERWVVVGTEKILTKISKFSINLHIIEYWINEGPQSHRKWVFNGNWLIDFSLSLSNVLSQLITTRYHRNRAKSSSVHSRCLHRQHRRHRRHRPTHAHRRWTSCVEKRKSTRPRYFTVSMQSPCLASTFHRWVSIMPWHRIIVAKRAITSRPTISTSSPLITTITIIA